MKRVLGFLCALLLVFGVVANVQAVPLGDLFGGATITVGDKLFDEWELFFDNSSDPPDFALIEVNSLVDQPFNPGLRFEAGEELTVLGENNINLGFGFRVSTLTGEPLIKDNSLEIPQDDFSLLGDGSSIEIFEDVFDLADVTLAEKEVFAGLGLGEQLFDSAEFAPQAEIFVEKFISVISDPSAGEASLRVFEQRFSQVQAPEPATMLLLATGLAGLAGLRRKFKR